MGYMPFMLRFGHNPIVLPPLECLREPIGQDKIDAHALIDHMHQSLQATKDNLMVAKITQAFKHNKSWRAKEFPYVVGDSVLLSILHHRQNYMRNGMSMAKFLPRFNGPYIVVNTHEDASTVTLNLPNDPSAFPTFHISLVKPFQLNDDQKYPHRFIPLGDNQEFWVDKIIDHKPWGHSQCYLVSFQGYPDSFNCWLSGSNLEGNSALAKYLTENPL
jgi:hypothetical protein